MTVPYRLGLDLGSNSIGWFMVRLKQIGRDVDGHPRFTPHGVLDGGVRILTPNAEAGRDPQSGASLAADRRAARAARRRRDRFLRRRKRLMETLVEAGLMPADVAARKALERLDPYWLRAAALDGPLNLHEIGRAVFHLNQRRGFQSNRIADAGDDEKGATKQGMKALEAKLAGTGCRTLGEFLARRHGRDKHGNRVADTPLPVRFRPTAQGTKVLYALYPARWLIRQELEAIWAAQAPHHPALTPALLARILRIVIDQRPLKKPPVGRCTLRPDAGLADLEGLTVDLGERAPKAHPLFQRFRMLQDAVQLRVTRPGGAERPLRLEERDAVVAKLASASAATVSFEALRKAAKLPAEARFNYELSGRAGFQSDRTAAKLAARKLLGKTWRALPRDRRIAVVERLLAVEDPEALVDWLTATLAIDRDMAERVSETRLPQGHGQFGRAVLGDLVAAMESRGRTHTDPETGEVYDRPLTYDEAVAEIGLHHSDLRADATASRLAYYGQALARHVIAKPDAPDGSQERIGRIANPTVHIALNEMRRLVNALIETHGPPAEIVVELGRELKLSQARKDEIARQNRDNEKENDRRRALLAKLGREPTAEAMLRLRLFDELPADEKVCVYTGTPLSVERLFDGSVDIDHILPFSKTLDDGFTNKVLCDTHANREKGNRAPGQVQAWSGARLADIAERATRLFDKKAWRFQPDAMARFEAEGGFLQRQLTDTQYMARLAKTYLETICPQVWAPPGRLTAILRGKWGLNQLLPDHNFARVSQPKNRKDHRHHAIDAFVLACTDRGLLQRIATASARAEHMDLDRLFPKGEFPDPFDGFRDALRARLDAIVVSHKPDHGLAPGAQDDIRVTSGRLHEATAHGLVDEEIEGRRYNLVTRKPIAGLSEAEIGRVRDARLRETLNALIAEARGDGPKLPDAERRALLARFGEEHGIRRVRVLKTEESVRVVRHRDALGREFRKAYSPGDNHRVEIFETPEGGWAGEGVTVFDANTPGHKPAWREAHPGARLVMRVHNGDMLEADFGDGRKIYRVYRLEPSAKRVRLVAHNEAGAMDQRHTDPDDPLRWVFATFEKMRAAGARRVRVDVLGRVGAADAAQP